MASANEQKIEEGEEAEELEEQKDEDTDADDPLSVKGWKVYLGAGRMEAQKLAVTQEVRYP